MTHERLDVMLALLCRSLDPTPADFVCFDRRLEPVLPVADVPVHALVEIARDVLANGKPVCEVAIAEGRLMASCAPLRVDGDIVGVVCQIDNPQRANDERELVAQAEWPMGIFDEDLGIRFVNAAWEAVVPLDTELSPGARTLLSRALRGETVHFEDVAFGTARLHGIARPYVTALGAIAGVAVACYRSSEELRLGRQHAAAEVQLEARQRNEFVAKVSHELRAPLAATLLWEKVLRDEHVAPAIRTRALDAIRDSATTGARLVADLLDISRAINGKLRVERHPVELAEVFSAALETARALAGFRELNSNLEAAREPVLGDATRLRQVFTNILANAIKNTGASGRVEVVGRRFDEHVEISIADNGRGIAPDLLPHVFEPFRQAEPGKEGGLGLGLAIASQLVALHGGSLTASSEGLGRGATFTVRLPIAKSAAADVHPVSRPTLAGVHVLVIDDDQRVLGALKLLLEQAGAIVDTAESGDAALGALEQAVPDVVLSDLTMPGSDGCSTIRKLRRREPAARRVPAVAMTSHVTDSTRHDAIAAGFDRYLTKPLDIDHLISTIATLVR